MHFHGVVHSDIKPASIFVKIVDEREVIKFGDFGMAPAPKSLLRNGHLLLEWCYSDLDKIWCSVKQTSGVR
jgi:serine/threonine protein kinase